jgi:uncharacterized protein YceK
MIRIALCLLLSGCAARVEVLPTFDPKTYAVGCCVVMAQISPSTDLSVTVQKTESLQVKLGAAWRF